MSSTIFHFPLPCSGVKIEIKIDYTEKLERYIERTAFKNKNLLLDIFITSVTKYRRDNIEYSSLLRRGFLVHICEVYMEKLFGKNNGFSLEVDRGSDWLHIYVKRDSSCELIKEASRIASLCMVGSPVIINYDQG